MHDFALDSPVTVRKPAFFADFIECKQEVARELPNVTLEDCDSFEEDSTSSEDLNTVLNKRKNRRKSVAPQKAVQHHNAPSGGHTSESSQELPSEVPKPFKTAADLDLLSDNESFLQDDELLCEINEEDIFKGLKEEVEGEGEKIEREVLANVKDEWRAHWGIKCNMCEQVFSYKADFDRHYQESYALVPVYTCTCCNKTSEKYTSFRSHCYRHVTEGRYKCHECQKGFSLLSMLQVHLLAKHTKAKPYSCNECGKSFVTKPGLKIHLKKHRSEHKEDYPCVECGKILHTRGGLTSHMNVHRLGRRFMCDVCGKTFTQKVNMQQHVKQHTGDKPHSCDKCGKTFAEKSHLARHYSFHSDQRPFKCDVCQKMYKTERCLKVHSLVHSTARPFVCCYCNKGFLSSTKLKQHYNIHTGERPYKCKYCERTFTNYPNWLKHTRRRHKVDHKTGEVLQQAQSSTVATATTSTAPGNPQKNLESSSPKRELSELENDGIEKEEKVSESETYDITLPLTTTGLALATEQLMADISLGNAGDDLMPYQGVNFPNDVTAQMAPHGDIAGSGGSSMGVFMPYFPSSTQNLLQTTTNVIIPMQFNDYVHAQYFQQPLI